MGSAPFILVPGWPRPTWAARGNPWHIQEGPYGGYIVFHRYGQANGTIRDCATFDDAIVTAIMRGRTACVVEAV